MELLLALLIATGTVTTSSDLTKSEADALVKSTSSSSDAIIWDAEGDDF